MRFLVVKQEGIVVDFRKWFEIYAVPVLELPPVVLESMFLNGLNPTVRAEVVSRRPVGLREIMKEAQYSGKNAKNVLSFVDFKSFLMLLVLFE